MNVQDLAKEVAKETGEPIYKVSKILAAGVLVIRKQILKAQIIKLKRLASLFIDVVPEKKYYNINEKKMDILPRRFVLKMVVSRDLKKEIDAKKTY